LEVSSAFRQFQCALAATDLEDKWFDYDI